MRRAPRPGELSERVRLEVPVESTDETGGLVRSFEDRGALWARIAPVAAEAHARADRAGERLRFEAVLRSPDEPLARGMRLVWKGRILEIRTVRPLDARAPFVVLDCVERR